MMHTRLLIAVVLLLLLVLVARRAPGVPRWMSASAWPAWLLPLVAACLTGGLTTWIWGGWRALPVVDDEVAYLLQAQLFAHGHWALPSPPAAAAFTQLAVLVMPVLAPKMPPGHALLLVPGVLLGWPGLVPVLLSALTGALVIVLARRVAGSAIAVLTLVIWLSQGSQMRWRASYFSEVATGMLWLLGWWLLLRWREKRDPRWLLLLALATGWGAIIRPLTMLAFAIPVGVVVFRDVVRHRLWKQFTLALAVGTAVLLILPWQNHAVLGNWRRSPLVLYTRQYMPFDRIGFGYDSTPPLLELPEESHGVRDMFIDSHRDHQPAALPGILYSRLRIMWTLDFLNWRRVLLPGAVIGLVLLSGEGWFALLTMLVLYIGYLLYSHEPYWSVYYLESTPVVAFIVALGTAWWLRWAAGARWFSPLLATGVIAIVVIVAAPDWVQTRVGRINIQQPLLDFRDSVRALPEPRVLVFVRYSNDHDPDVSVVRNVSDPASAHALVAYDLGIDADRRVLAAYPGRVGYLWTESDGRLEPLPR